MRERGGVPVLLLFLLLAGAAAAVIFFARRAEPAPKPTTGIASYSAFRLVRGKLPDAALEDALLQSAARALTSHGLASRGEGQATAADEIAVVMEPQPSAPDRAVTVRLVTSAGSDVCSVPLTGSDAKSLREIAEANLAAMLTDKRFER
jgi:hypothetical protein